MKALKGKNSANPTKTEPFFIVCARTTCYSFDNDASHLMTLNEGSDFQKLIV
ncbi:hypothetical protein [Mesobacillus zeae]|uniref:hypothetical protein n=1 Tax=Mesobacillus zeae TaxID=1917180 RepID=UPI0015E67682|nr:hypothetical protein [Mesobacillus zeae]